MQSFELLGGKYQQGEQIATGVIQTFRSYEVPTCRPVFIHRIPMDHAAVPGLAELLSAGLIRSSTVRKTIVDLYEIGPHRFVVTEPVYQCLPFLDWLEREAGTPVVRAEEKTETEPPKVQSTTEQVTDPKVATANPANVTAEDASDPEWAKLFREALARNVEGAGKSQPAVAAISIPPVVELPTDDLSVSTEAPQMFTPIMPPPTGRSNLILFLVVLGVVVVVMAMGVVLFLKR